MWESTGRSFTGHWGVFYSRMPIDNAAIQLTVVDSRAIDLWLGKAISPRGYISPRGEVGVHDAPHWIDRNTTCGESGVFGKGGGKNEIFGGDRQVKSSQQPGNTSPTRRDSRDLCPSSYSPPFPRYFQRSLNLSPALSLAGWVLKALILAP